MQRLTVRPSVEAQERIEALITRQDLRPGDRLPTERDLAARWGISRAAVRAALPSRIPARPFNCPACAGCRQAAAGDDVVVEGVRQRADAV